MKNIILLLQLLLVSTTLKSQLVSAETNGVYLDFNSINTEKVLLPKVQWTFPTSLYTNSQENKINFKSTITSPVPITEIKLELSKTSDFVKILASKMISFDENATEVAVDQVMNLLDGENNIRIVATNNAGGKVADYRNILIGMDAISKAVDINRKDYALFIATDKYDQWSDLVNPIFDAETIADELKTSYGFETEVLLNPAQDDILIKIKEYAAKKYRPQDQLFIFVAGHGQFDETFKEGYLVTKNSLRNDPAKSSYIAHSILRNVVNNIPCEHILLTMDVCFSGTFDPVIARRGDLYENVDNSEMLVRLLSKKTRKYLTSGGKEYVSDGVPGQHSPFAMKFLEVLKGRGGEDQIITMPEVYSTMQGLKTLPRTGGFGDDENDSDFVFVLSK